MGMQISQLNVRHSIYISTPQRHVWSEFETFERFQAWYSTGHELETYEPKTSGLIEQNVTINGIEHPLGGVINVFAAEEEISFSYNWFTERAWSVPTFITIRLSPCFEGTLVEHFHHGFDRLGDKAGRELQRYEAGWTSHHLERLKNICENQGLNEEFDLNPIE